MMKFGGAALQNPDSIGKVTSVIKAMQGENLVVVVSAFGKTTRLLDSFFEMLSLGKIEAAMNIVIEKFSSLSLALCEEPLDSKDLSECLSVVTEVIEELKSYVNAGGREWNSEDRDVIVSYGEIVTSRIIHFILNRENIKADLLDARDMILTDEKHRFASPDYKKSIEKIKEKVDKCHKVNALALTQGFIASTPSGLTTTLGYEGSDLTATFMGSCLNVERIEIYKSVPGILTADPEILSECRKIRKISYSFAEKLAYLGSKILHRNAIKPAKEKNIPIEIKNIHKPDDVGTIIGKFDSNGDNSAFSVIGHPDGTLLSLRFPAEHNLNGSIRIESILAQWDIVNVPIQSNDNFPQWFLTEKVLAKAALHQLKEAGAVFMAEEVSMIGILCDSLSENGYTQMIKETLDEQYVDLVTSIAMPDMSIMVVLREQFKKVYASLHRKLLEYPVAASN